LQIDLSVFNPGNRPLVGLDVSSSSIKMVELSRADKGGMKVERYAIELLPREAVVDGKIINIEAIAETIAKALRRMGTNASLVAMALPTAAVITKKIILPANLREQEMEVQVESEANQYIPFALEEVNLDFQVIGPAPSGPDEVEVLLAASRKEMVEDRVACALGAGLKAWVMDVEAYAAQAAFELVQTQLPGSGRDQCIALVDVGASVMNVTMMRNDQTVYSREQAFGGAQLTQDIMRAYGMSLEEAEAGKRSGSLPDNYQKEILSPFLESLAMEVTRALQFFFTSTQYTQVDHIVLSGGCATLPHVTEEIFARTQVNTIVANPFANMTLATRVKERALLADAPSLMIACGLALRRFDQ